MLTVTDTATTYLKGLLDEAKLDEGVTLRLVAGEQGLGLAPDTAKDNDTSFESDGNTVLVVNEDLAGKLGDITLDVQQTEQGPRLALG